MSRQSRTPCQNRTVASMSGVTSARWLTPRQCTVSRVAAIYRIYASRVLLVDAANVVGSRPDGWWRDRPGAARRLYDAIRSAVADGRLEGPVVVVVEGQAR